jgi:hypothetical protein
MFRKCRLFVVGLWVLSPVLVAFTNPAQPAEQKNGVPWWFWVLIILLVLAALLWWWWSSRKGRAAPSAKVEASAPVPTPAPSKDDLKRIEGVGPKISDLLQAAGITTFAQLAAADLGRLEQIVEDAGIGRIANPSTWAEQAALAAAGKWDELAALQDDLKGGRRV